MEMKGNGEGIRERQGEVNKPGKGWERNELTEKLNESKKN